MFIDLKKLGRYCHEIKNTPVGSLNFFQIVNVLSGDFNCKSPWWGYRGTDPVGRSLQALVQRGGVVFLNERGAPTLRQGTTPDLSLATGDLAGRCRWRAGEFLGSDHRTILIHLSFKNSARYTNRIVPMERKINRRTLTAKRVYKAVKKGLTLLYRYFARKPRRRTK